LAFVGLEVADDLALKGADDTGDPGAGIADERDPDGAFGTAGPPRGRLGLTSPLALETLKAADSFCRSSEGRGTRNEDFLGGKLPEDDDEDDTVIEAVVAVDDEEEAEAKSGLPVPA